VKTIAGVRFTEAMRGYVTIGERGAESGARTGRATDTRLALHLTVEVEDLDRFAADARHEARLTGWVDCDALGGRLPVEWGAFQLFPDEGDPTRGRMRYRLFFRDGVGHPLTLVGVKVARRDRPARVWRDTTTLYTRVVRGHEAAGGDGAAEVVAAGIVRIGLLDFLRQLATFRARGASRAAGAAAIGRFGVLFLTRLGRVYGLGAPRRPRSRKGTRPTAGR
jgi:cholesterol oxidase